MASSQGWRTWLTLAAIVFAFAALMLACVRQWGSPQPWSRLDAFSGGYMALGLTLFVQQMIFAAQFSTKEETRRVFYSLDIDPGFERWVACLGLAEIAVFLDYAHWHLMPALDKTSIKTAGLVLYLLTFVWLLWVDFYLFRNFARAHEQGVLLTGGPFRRVRHPRYSGLLFTRICLALMLASPIGWGVCAAWIVIIQRRIRREERYLRGRFPDTYDSYASKTPQLIPGYFSLIPSVPRELP